jgi:anti-sigma regulatory factor (Ser/Thr protein kinase)
VSISSELTTTNNSWWRHLRLRLTLLYMIVACILLLLSAIGHVRILSQVGQTFGGFFWGIDTDRQVDIVSVPSQLPPLDASPGSLTGTDHLVKVNGSDISALSGVYSQAHPGELITYTVEQNGRLVQFTRPAVTFTWEMWLQNYGLALFAGISWLLVGGILLATAKEWTGAVEGITMLPPAMLFLLYSHWGNVQRAYQPDVVFQLLWVPAFALLGAAFIHLSLTYRPEALSMHRKPSLRIDSLPYLPLIALVAYDVSSYLIRGSVPTRLQFIMALGYAVLGGVLSLIIGVGSLLRISRLLPGTSIPANVRRRLGDLLTLWIGGVGLGFCLGILPILLTGKPLLPLEIFYVLATVYPLILWYAIRSLRLIERLEMTLAQREEALRVQQKTEAELRRANMELQRATSLLLHADAHLRSLLSQRIHDQPKQQALRIRSLLGHWQHKLKVEAEREPYARHLVQPVIEALGKVRKISEELEGDLRGLQLLVEDAYQRRSLGLKLHLEKLIREDLPALHPESLLKVQPDLWALDELSQDLEQTAEGEKIAEAISYTVTQALLNVYNHAGASYATVRTARSNDFLEVYIIDDGRGFETSAVSPEKTSLFKAQLKAREAGGTLTIRSITRPKAQHGTTVILRLPFPETERPKDSGPLPHSMVQEF